MQTVSLHGCRRVERHATGAAGALFDKTLLDRFFGIAFTQAVQTDSALGSRWLYGSVFPVGSMFDHITFFLKQHEERLEGVGLPRRS